MKNYIKNGASRLQGFALGCFSLVLASGVFSASCIKDRNNECATVIETEAWMLLTVRLPQTTTTTTRADVDPESEITDVRVLILEETAGSHVYRYQAVGYEIEPSGNMQRYRVRLYATDDHLKIMVLINSEQALASYTPADGDSEATIREQLTMAFTSAGLSGGLPMYGELTLEEGVGTGTTSIQMTAIRSIARVDVVKNLEAGTDEFILEEVHIFRANDRIQLAYNELVSSGAPLVDTPSVPSGASLLAAAVTKTEPDGADAITQIYIPESNAVMSEVDRRLNATVVVVGGRWGGEGGDLSYYRADFDPDGQFGQILRNHRYIFNIIRVSAPGWDTPQEAADNTSSSIVVEVQAWEDFSSDMYFGENSFALSSREIALRYIADRQKRLDVESTLEYRIEWLDGNGQPTGAATSESGVVISNDYFDVSIVRDGGDPETVSHLLFRTRQNNHAGNVIVSGLRVTVDNWDVDITVSQDNSAMYSNLHFNVLSGTDSSFPVGQLGTTSVLPTDDTFSDGGLAMRRILDEQFAPDGVIRIGGFAFDQVNDGTSLLASATPANVANMERIIRMQNVIYLSYSVAVSQQVAQSILNWLDEDPHRVLIAGYDNSDTNTNLRALLAADGSWTFTGISAANYTRAGETVETVDFFAGPFGTVDAGASFAKYDNTLGYCASPSGLVTQLITGVNNNASVMIFGVNKGRRIIYHGDANLFQLGPLSNNNGTVSSNLDRLMANVWAWVTEQLIYGDD